MNTTRSLLYDWVAALILILTRMLRAKRSDRILIPVHCRARPFAKRNPPAGLGGPLPYYQNPCSPLFDRTKRQRPTFALVRLASQWRTMKQVTAASNGEAAGVELRRETSKSARHIPAPATALAAGAALLLPQAGARAHGPLHEQIEAITMQLQQGPTAELFLKRGELYRAHQNR